MLDLPRLLRCFLNISYAGLLTFNVLLASLPKVWVTLSDLVNRSVWLEHPQCVELALLRITT